MALGFLIGLWGVFNSLTPRQIEHFLLASPFSCPLRTFTGFKCAFCGMTHAWIAIFKGEWKEAFQQNRLSIPLFFSILLYLSLNALGKLPKFSHPVRRISLAFLLILLSLYAVLRNT